ncbi:restriction endonuclease subunit S [Halomonas sp. LS-001]
MSFSVVQSYWRNTTLEECVDILDSKRIPVNNKDRQRRIENKSPNQLYPYFGATGEVGKIDDYLFDEELVALGEDGVPFLDPRKPKAYMLFGKTWVNNHAHVLKAAEGVTSNRFLLHFLNQFDYQEYVNGGTRLKLTQANMRRMPFPLPPLAEQKAIADKLDTLLAQVETTQARLERIPQSLKRFRQSVLAAAVSGKLKEDGELDDRSWPLTKLSNLCATAFDGPFGSKLKSSDYTDDGVGVVRLENIKHLSFDQSKETFISEEKYLTLEKNKLQKNDLLFSSFVDEEIRACLFPFETLRFINKADCFCLRIDQEKALPEFVLYLLTSQYSYAQIKEHVQGVTRPRVNLKILKSLEFPIPPVQAQSEIVRRVNQLFAHAERIEQQVNNALARVNNLTQSILAKAFRGELTEQWRKDNPELISGENSAEALLERIKEERAAKAPIKRTRRKATT